MRIFFLFATASQESEWRHSYKGSKITSSFCIQTLIQVSTEFMQGGVCIQSTKSHIGVFSHRDKSVYDYNLGLLVKDFFLSKGVPFSSKGMYFFLVLL